MDFYELMNALSVVMYKTAKHDLMAFRKEITNQLAAVRTGVAKVLYAQQMLFLAKNTLSYCDFFVRDQVVVVAIVGFRFVLEVDLVDVVECLTKEMVWVYFTPLAVFASRYPPR